MHAKVAVALIVVQIVGALPLHAQENAGLPGPIAQGLEREATRLAIESPAAQMPSLPAPPPRAMRRPLQPMSASKRQSTPLALGQYVDVFLVAGPKLTGRVVDMTPVELTVEPWGGLRHTIPFDAIDKVIAILGGGLAGARTGALGGLAVGGAYCVMLLTLSDSPPNMSRAIPAVLPLAAMSSAVGALIGAVNVHREVVYQR